MADEEKAGFWSSTGDAFMKASGIGAITDTYSQWRTRLNNKGKPPAKAKTYDVKFEGISDIRARIKIPSEYWANEITPLGGLPPDAMPTGAGGGYNLSGFVYFPYTPTITQEHTAVYNTVNPTHSNYGLHFYKHSSVGPITVAGKFTVQSEHDARVWIATTHILRAVTKMKFGADKDRGAPPPVCRFFAYGPLQYNNVPVVIQSIRVELPDSVDYYSTPSYEANTGSPNVVNAKGVMVPTVSTITITMLPMYSRKELLELAHVEGFLQGTDNAKERGFL